MATSDERSSIESEESTDCDFYCTPCSQEYKTVEAEKYCQDCLQNLCTQCLQQHNKFDGMKDHLLTDRQDTRTVHLESVRYMCKIHSDKPLVVYCNGCDQLCCNVCATLDHRGCMFVDYFPRKSKKISSTSEFQGITESLHQIQEELEVIEKARELDGEQTDMCATHVEQMISNYREKINAVLDEIVAKVRTENQQRHSKLQERIQRDIKMIIKTLNLIKDEIKHTETNASNDVRTYINMKHAHKTRAGAQNFIKDMKRSVGKGELIFTINEGVKEMLECINSENQFGYFSKRHEVHREGRLTDIITGCLAMGDNIIMTTKGHNSVKKLDTYLNILDSLILSDIPCKLCTVSMTEVAMSIQKCIQFISIKNELAITRLIDLDCKLDGIGFISDQLYLTRSAGFLNSCMEVMVYDLIGSSIQVLNKCDGKEDVFKYPRDIATDTENGLIYITDERKGIIILDQEGNHLTTVCHPEMKSPKHLCMGNSGKVYVTDSKSIFELSPNGENLTVLLDERYGINCPTSICFHGYNSRLYVAMETGIIKIFDIN